MKQAIFRTARQLALPGACLLTAALTAACFLHWHAQRQLLLLDGFCTALLARAPDCADAVLTQAKFGGFTTPAGPGVLADLGYTAQDFAPGAGPFAAALAAAALGLCLLGPALAVSGRRLRRRVRQLTERLEDARAGRPLPLWGDSGDLFGPLADELGKTVTELNHTRQAALDARDRFARSLADIAHQLKTPLAALSLAGQAAGGAVRRQIEPQVERLTRLEEALLLLARLDADALPLRPTETDAFTLLMLAADQVQPLAAEAGVTLDIREAPPMALRADPDWTVEALLNLLKNCVEHAPAGSAVHGVCTRNALYTEIVLRDEGAGFAAADLPHLFERFYRGQGARPGSTGIGLAIARELLARQNAVLNAGNAPQGGGQFTVRFYLG